MKAIGKYILIEKISEEVKTSSGLLLSGGDIDQMRYRKGRVIVPGTDVSTISEGDIVYYDKGHSFTMMVNDAPVTVIREADVVVVESPRSS